MQVNIKATQKELEEKSDKLVLAVASLLDNSDSELSNKLVKAIQDKSVEFDEPVLQELLKIFSHNYNDQIQKMIQDIEKVLKGESVWKSLDDGISYFHLDADGSYIEDFELLEKGGPVYIGPRGGKWADPAHTIPYQEDVHAAKEIPKERYEDEKAKELMFEMGEALFHMQAEDPLAKDDTGFNNFDMQWWKRGVFGISNLRRILKKYKRQLINSFGDDYYKCGIHEQPKNPYLTIKPKYTNNGDLIFPTDGSRLANRKAFDDYVAIQKKYELRFNGDHWKLAEPKVDDFDFDSYRKDLEELGHVVDEIIGEKKSKEVKEKEKKELDVAEALRRIKNRQIENAIVLKKVSPTTFAFIASYSPEFNDLFSNKKGLISGVFKVNKERNWARETSDINLVEEAIEKIKRHLPKHLLVIDEEALKEAQIARDQYAAELEKPIPEVQRKLAPEIRLYPYQNEAVRFLDTTNGNALIGDEMGLGKTLESLAWVAKEDKKTIIVCPKVVRRTWLQEGHKFFPNQFKTAELIAKDLRSGNVPDLKDKNLVSVNYESLHKFYPLLKEAGFDTIIIDESHRMKNPKAKTTKSLQKITELMKHKILLSGTAIKNKKEELFTQINVVAPGMFSHKDQVKFATIGGLWEQMKKFYIARAKATVLKDLPEKSTSIILNEMSGLPDYTGNVQIGDIAGIKAGVAIGKAPYTANFVKELLESSDSRILVFSDSVEAAKKIKEELGDIAVLHHGQMADEKREQIKEEFQRKNSEGDYNSQYRVLVTTRQSMAVGATLTAADKVVFNDLPWNAADLRQAEDRCHRVGQKNNVNVYWMTADNNTFDSSVVALINRKYELSKKVNQGKKLTDEEIKWMEKPVNIEDIMKRIQGADVDLLKRKEEIMPIDEPDKKVPIAQEEQEEKEDNWKEKDSKSKNEAPKGSIDNPLPALPKDTDLVLKPSTFSSWDGKLAIVEGPSYYERKDKYSLRNIHGESKFDPETFSHPYYIMYAIDAKTKVPISSEERKEQIGRVLSIPDKDRNTPYNKLVVQIGGMGPSYMPITSKIDISFADKIKVWVKQPFNRLTEEEKDLVLEHLKKEKGYIEVNVNRYDYLPVPTWKKIINLSYKEIMDMDNVDITNAIEELLTKFSLEKKKRGEDGELPIMKTGALDLAKVWELIPGMYVRDKSGTLKNIIPREVFKESKVEEPKVEEPKVEESKVEESKVEESKVEESKVGLDPLRSNLGALKYEIERLKSYIYNKFKKVDSYDFSKINEEISKIEEITKLEKKYNKLYHSNADALVIANAEYDFITKKISIIDEYVDNYIKYKNIYEETIKKGKALEKEIKDKYHSDAITYATDYRKLLDRLQTSETVLKDMVVRADYAKYIFEFLRDTKARGYSLITYDMLDNFAKSEHCSGLCSGLYIDNKGNIRFIVKYSEEFERKIEDINEALKFDLGLTNSYLEGGGRLVIGDKDIEKIVATPIGEKIKKPLAPTIETIKQLNEEEAKRQLSVYQEKIEEKLIKYGTRHSNDILEEIKSSSPDLEKLEKQQSDLPSKIFYFYKLNNAVEDYTEKYDKYRIDTEKYKKEALALEKELRKKDIAVNVIHYNSKFKEVQSALDKLDKLNILEKAEAHYNYAKFVLNELKTYDSLRYAPITMDILSNFAKIVSDAYFVVEGESIKLIPKKGIILDNYSLKRIKDSIKSELGLFTSTLEEDGKLIVGKNDKKKLVGVYKESAKDTKKEGVLKEKPFIIRKPITEEIKEEPKGEIVQIKSKIPDSQLTENELVERIKSYGQAKQKSYGLYVKARNLKPVLDAKDFYELWDHVGANPHEEIRDIKFKATHKSKDGYTTIMVTERLPGVTKFIVRYKNGSVVEGSAPSGTFDQYYEDINAEVGETKEELKVVEKPQEREKADINLQNKFDSMSNSIRAKEIILEKFVGANFSNLKFKILEDPVIAKLEKIYNDNLDRSSMQAGINIALESGIEYFDKYGKALDSYIAQYSKKEPIKEVTKEPALTIPKRGRGRPRKEKLEIELPKRPRGRPPKIVREPIIMKPEIEPKPVKAPIVRQPILTIPKDEPVKRGRGRPRKEKLEIDELPKRPRGRPRKEKPEVEVPKRTRGRPRKFEIPRVPVKLPTVKLIENQLSLVSAKNIELSKIGEDATHFIYKTNMPLDDDDARLTMKQIRQKGINVMVIPGRDGLIKIRKED